MKTIMPITPIYNYQHLPSKNGVVEFLRHICKDREDGIDSHGLRCCFLVAETLSEAYMFVVLCFGGLQTVSFLPQNDFKQSSLKRLQSQLNKFQWNQRIPVFTMFQRNSQKLGDLYPFLKSQILPKISQQLSLGLFNLIKQCHFLNGVKLRKWQFGSYHEIQRNQEKGELNRVNDTRYLVIVNAGNGMYNVGMLDQEGEFQSQSVRWSYQTDKDKQNQNQKQKEEYKDIGENIRVNMDNDVKIQSNNSKQAEFKPVIKPQIKSIKAIAQPLLIPKNTLPPIQPQPHQQPQPTIIAATTSNKTPTTNPKPDEHRSIEHRPYNNPTSNPYPKSNSYSNSSYPYYSKQLTTPKNKPNYQTPGNNQHLGMRGSDNIFNRVQEDRMNNQKVKKTVETEYTRESGSGVSGTQANNGPQKRWAQPPKQQLRPIQQKDYTNPNQYPTYPAFNNPTLNSYQPPNNQTSQTTQRIRTSTPTNPTNSPPLKQAPSVFQAQPQSQVQPQHHYQSPQQLIQQPRQHPQLPSNNKNMPNKLPLNSQKNHSFQVENQVPLLQRQKRTQEGVIVESSSKICPCNCQLI